MKQQKLKELLTPEFLSTLHSAVECCGWRYDMLVLITFCDWCYDMAGQQPPECDMSVEMEEE